MTKRSLKKIDLIMYGDGCLLGSFNLAIELMIIARRVFKQNETTLLLVLVSFLFLISMMLLLLLLLL